MAGGRAQLRELRLTCVTIPQSHAREGYRLLNFVASARQRV